MAGFSMGNTYLVLYNMLMAAGSGPHHLPHTPLAHRTARRCLTGMPPAAAGA